MSLEPIAIPPGIFQNGTRYNAKGRWHRCDLLRFHDGIPQPMGGWEVANNAASFTGRPCAQFSWIDNSGNGWIAVGTHSKLYVYDETFTRYDITPAGFTTGNADAGTYGGYGAGPYGQGAYSVPQPLSGGLPLEASSWSFDTWGENLVAQFMDSGPIYEWTLNTGVVAAAITNSPTGSRCIVVTDERILLAFGAGGDFRRVRGSDSEDNTDWTPAITNQSIDRNISISTRVMGARKFRGETLLFAGNQLVKCSYVRPPYVYTFKTVGEGFGICGINAVAVTDDAVIWMGPDNFWIYDGGGVRMLECEIGGELFRDINLQQMSKIYASVNSSFSEVIFHYPSEGSSECDAYVIYNYGLRIWYRGDGMARLCRTDRGVFPRPYAMDASGVLYEHEIEGGSLGGGTVFLESGPLEPLNGEHLYTLHKLYMDDTAANDTGSDTPADLQLYIKAQNYPRDTERQIGPLDPAIPRGARITGRHMFLRFEGSAGTWRIGNYRADIRRRGSK